METVKVIDQKLIAEIADKHSDPAKLTLSIALEATMETHYVFDHWNQILLLRKIQHQIDIIVNDEVRRMNEKTAVCSDEEPTEADAWDGDDTHHINHGC